MSAESIQTFAEITLLEKQWVIMRLASEHAAGYVFLNEHNTDKETGESSKFALVAFCSNSFTTGRMFLTMHAKDFLAMHLAFVEFGHIMWGTKRPTIVMTYSEALPRFFEAKCIAHHSGIFLIKRYKLIH